MKIFLDSIGCRLNQSEIEGFANQFKALGHQIVSHPGEADVAIVNTCTVTVKAAADSRKHLRRANREGAQAVIATGCWVTLEPEAARELPGVTKVVVNAHKDALVADILQKPLDEIAALPYIREPLPGDRARTRAFIKVQEGCDNHCTYCLTRLARGASRSRELFVIQKDIQAALDGGAQEIVLTGVQLGAWGRDFPTPKGLSDLLAGILTNQQIARVRLSSIEPWEFDVKMLSLWQDSRLCRHLHIPLQPGSDRILNRMGRPIATQDYRALIDDIRAKIPDVALTTDVIAGFPGESDADFEATKAFINAVGFAGGHAFTYSPRPGTDAFSMEGRIQPDVAKNRNAELRVLFASASHEFQERFIGRTMPVLWESRQQNQYGFRCFSGLTDNYIRVFASAKGDLCNTISYVTLNAYHPDRNAIIGHVEG
jgi:threonylcarbamoyladenosine tRNA methylthiotransferase MtaB